MRIWNGYQRGINLGGWLSQCKHAPHHYNTFITEKDFSTIAEWGLDHVRIPIDYELLESAGGVLREEGFSRIQTCLDWCEKYHLNMILDLHKTAGYSFDQQHADEFFDNPALQARFISLWGQIARRFGAHEERLAFELLNEVVNEEIEKKWNKIAANAIEAIRSVAPKIKILVGGIWNNSATAIPRLDPPSDKNIVYNFHCYEPIVFTYQGADWVRGMIPDFRVEYPDTLDDYRRFSAAVNKRYTEPLIRPGITDVEISMFELLIAGAAEYAEKYDVSLYCGEYGVIHNADLKSTLHWYRTIHKIFERYGIGRAAWTYKEMEFGLTDPHMEPILNQILPLL